MKLLGSALVAAILFSACGGSSRHTIGREKAMEVESMPPDVVERADQNADTSKNPSTSIGGCGGWLNPCPDVLNPNRGGPLGCLFCSSGSGGSDYLLSLLFLGMCTLPLRRRRGSFKR